MTPTREKKFLHDWEEIKQRLPHRYPFLLIDRVIDVDRSGHKAGTRFVGIKVHALKLVSGNEPYLQGHFPELAVVPGVLMIEMMAQSSIFALPDELTAQGTPEVFLSKIEKCRFRTIVRPGDILDIHTTIVKEKQNFVTTESMIIERNTQFPICEATILAYFDFSKVTKTSS